MLIANTLAGPADQIFAHGAGDAHHGACLDSGSLCYTLQIYFDFSGYSDMAIGLGRMFGFRFPENFEYPYVAVIRSGLLAALAHVAVGLVPRLRLHPARRQSHVDRRGSTSISSLVFFLCGLWHGASWTFVVWGLFHGVFLVLERVGLARVIKAAPPARAPCLRTARRDRRLGVLPRRNAVGGSGDARARWPDSAARDTGDLSPRRGIGTPEVLVAFVAGVIGSMPVVPLLSRRLEPTGWTGARRWAGGRHSWQPRGALCAVRRVHHAQRGAHVQPVHLFPILRCALRLHTVVERILIVDVRGGDGDSRRRDHSRDWARAAAWRRTVSSPASRRSGGLGVDPRCPRTDSSAISTTTSPFASCLVRWQATFRLDVLGVSPSEAVIKGRDGWLFYADDGALHDYVAGATLLERTSSRSGDRRCRTPMTGYGSVGVAYLFVVSPDKHLVYPEFMPRAIRVRGDIENRPAARVPGDTLDCEGPRSPTGTPRCQAARTPLSPDGHSLERSRRVRRLRADHGGARDVAARSGPASRSMFEPRHVESAGLDLAGMMGLTASASGRGARPGPETAARCSRRGTVTTPAAGSWTRGVVTEVPDGLAPRAVIFRDSFGSALIPFLSEHFSRAVYLWQYQRRARHHHRRTPGRRDSGMGGTTVDGRASV